MKYQDTIYYKDELNDDFANMNIEFNPLPKSYSYVSKKPTRKFMDFVVYRIIARPATHLYMRLKFLYKTKNRKILKSLRHEGCFIYANHTLAAGDAFSTNNVFKLKKNYIITGKETASLTLILPLLRAVGSLPLNDSFKAKKELYETVNLRIKQHRSVTIFPEAHIWPYYTKIRPFVNDSFKYPARMNAPIITLTNCYQKKLIGKRPKIKGYLAGPFYPDMNLPIQERAQKLRDEAYSSMVENANKYSTYNYYNYVKKED